MKEVKFEKVVNITMGVLTVIRKATKNGKPVGPGNGVSVTVSFDPRTTDRAEEIYQEFAADWKGSIAKYGVSVDA